MYILIIYIFVYIANKMDTNKIYKYAKSGNLAYSTLLFDR